MALTVTLSNDWRMSLGDRMAAKATIAFDNSYTTNGLSLTPAQLALGELDMVIIQPKAGYTFEFNYTTNKVLVYWVDTTVDGAPQAEVTNGTNLSTLTGVPVFAIGRP